MEMDVTPDLAAQSLLFLACVAAWVYRKPLVRFVTVECADNWVEKEIRKDELAEEARAILALFETRRWM